MSYLINQSINQSMTKVLVEQPLASPRSASYFFSEPNMIYIPAIVLNFG